MTYSYAWDKVFNPGKAVDFFQGTSPQQFETGKPHFSPTNAWWLAEMSRLIYVRGGHEADTACQTTARNQFLHRVGLEERWFYNGRYIQCSIVGPLPDLDDPFSVLVFRGTRRGVTNWFFLLNFILSPWPAGGRVHRGFKHVMLEAWEIIRQSISTGSKPMYYTGHSLGGSLAILAATLKKPEAVYTFGAPRMANAAFVNAVRHINIFRVVNPQDIVASIPPIPGVLHVGEAYYLPGSKASNFPRTWLEAPAFLADHSASNYCLTGKTDDVA